jgi:hypothetical protein
MKYTIEQERLMKVMMRFFNQMLPDFVLPLKKKVNWRKGNSGYGSSLDNYMLATTYYINDDGTWFINYDDKEYKLFSNTKWDINERLEPLYDYFGEESFELFVKWLFKIDLKDKGVFDNDWTLTDMSWVITENKNQIRKIIRRVEEDYYELEEVVIDGLNEDDPCDYDNKEDYLDSISKGSATVYIFKYVDEKYYGTESFVKIKEYIANLINERHSSEIIDHYVTSKKYCKPMINEYVVNEIPDDKLMKIINKLVRHIYGKELTMIENEHGYLRFFSDGPVPPYHRNLSGRLWVDDDRLEKNIEGLFGVDSEQSAALIAFYFSEKYGIKITDARPPLSMGWYERVIDYKMFDDPTFKVPNDD